MKKLLVLTLTAILLTGCGGMSPLEMQDKIIRCEDAGLGWWKNDFGEIRCSEHRNLEKVNPFKACTKTCEKMFREQARTWANGSESQSVQANECVKLCLDNL